MKKIILLGLWKEYHPGFPILGNLTFLLISALRGLRNRGSVLRLVLLGAVGWLLSSVLASAASPGSRVA